MTQRDGVLVGLGVVAGAACSSLLWWSFKGSKITTSSSCSSSTSTGAKSGCPAKRKTREPPSPLPTARVEIEFCVGCRWLLRASWCAQELLTTFEGKLKEVVLVPNFDGGVFDIRVDGATVFSRKQAGRFPEMKEAKQLVRDVVAPEKDLGHSDKQMKEAKQ